MKAKPEQVLSLLPGKYYHPEAELKVFTYPDGTKTRGHKVHGKAHGIWERYRPGGTLKWKRKYRYGEIHGVWEKYYKNGTLCVKKHWYHGELKLYVKYTRSGILEEVTIYDQGKKINLATLFQTASNFTLSIDHSEITTK